MAKLVKVIDGIGLYIGKVGRWGYVFLVLIIVYEVISRFVFNSPTTWIFSVTILTGTALAISAWSYTHYRNEHIRIDIFSMKWSEKTRLIVNIACHILLFFPVVILVASAAWNQMLFSIEIGERFTEGTYWIPSNIPIRIVMFLALCSFGLQGVAHIIRDLHLLLWSKLL